LLNLYKSNKIEVISELLAEELKICPPPISEKLEIVVPNYFLGNWLREQITIKNKISALYELKTISTYTESLLTNFFPAIDMSTWNSESIKWGIIDSLEELNSFKESFPLRNWINKYLDNKKTIDGDIYNLTKKITNNFIDYLIFRPEMIAEWNKYEINSLNLFKNLNTDQFWQPILYKLLEKKISEKPSCLYMIEVIKNLRKIKKVQNKIPNQIYIISDNNLSKLHINFYSELSKVTKVNLYLLSAGDDLWNRINCLEGELEFDNFESKLNQKNIKIEKIFGKFGANFQKLIEENINKEEFNVIDARSRERFEGKVAEPRKGLRSGSIKNSFCLPFSELVNEDHTFVSKEKIIEKFKSFKFDHDKNLVFSCGSGVTASVLALAYSLINAKYMPTIYDGSWAEYGKN